MNARLTERRGATVTIGAAEWNPDPSLISHSPGNSTRAYWLREPACQGPGPTSGSCSGSIVWPTTGLWTVALGDGDGGGRRNGTNAMGTTWHLGFRPAVWIRR